jgi:hypothetical protein
METFRRIGHSDDVEDLGRASTEMECYELHPSTLHGA